MARTTGERANDGKFRPPGLQAGLHRLLQVPLRAPFPLAARLAARVPPGRRPPAGGTRRRPRRSGRSRPRGGVGVHAGLDELARYSVIAGYLHHLRAGGSVLDVGSGEGLLADHLRPLGYSRYHGIDLSEAAIAQAAGRVAGTRPSPPRTPRPTFLPAASTPWCSTNASTTSTIRAPVRRYEPYPGRGRLHGLDLPFPPGGRDRAALGETTRCSRRRRSRNRKGRGWYGSSPDLDGTGACQRSAASSRPRPGAPGSASGG